MALKHMSMWHRNEMSSLVKIPNVILGSLTSNPRSQTLLVWPGRASRAGGLRA